MTTRLWFSHTHTHTYAFVSLVSCTKSIIIMRKPSWKKNKICNENWKNNKPYNENYNASMIALPIWKSNYCSTVTVRDNQNQHHPPPGGGGGHHSGDSPQRDARNLEIGRHALWDKCCFRNKTRHEMIPKRSKHIPMPGLLGVNTCYTRTHKSHPPHTPSIHASDAAHTL